MAVRWFGQLAAHAAVPVFAAVGAGMREHVERLFLDTGIRLVDSPRWATVLLVAGDVPAALHEPLGRVHDQVAHPRATVLWGGPRPRALPIAAEVPRADDPAPVLRRLHRDLVTAARDSEPDVLPDAPPNPWEGEGMHGQGGEGMMGGVPYGRPMAMTADDRDGLALDPLSVRLGPFLPMLPPGLTLDVVVQGDVLTDVAVREVPFPAGGSAAGATLAVFAAAARSPVTIREVEVARASAHLRHVARVLHLHGLEGMALRVRRLAETTTPGNAAAVRRLARRLRRLTALRWATEGVGVVPAELAPALAGPNARAAGRAEDARLDDPAYRQIGFEPVTQADGDAQARWRQRLAEAAQSLELAGRAGERTLTFDRVESPWGPLGPAGLDSRLLHGLPRVLSGMEIGDAVTTVASLDLDLEALALRPAMTGSRP